MHNHFVKFHLQFWRHPEKLVEGDQPEQQKRMVNNILTKNY